MKLVWNKENILCFVIECFTWARISISIQKADTLTCITIWIRDVLENKLLILSKIHTVKNILDMMIKSVSKDK